MNARMKVCLITAAAVTLSVSAAAQDLYRVKIDLKEKKTIPDNPAVNLNLRTPAIALDFGGDPRATPPQDRDQEFQVGYPDITSYIRVENLPGAITFGEKLFSLGTTHALTLRPCTAEALRKEGVLLYRPTLTSGGKPRINPPAHLVDGDVSPSMCPFAVLDRRWTNSWTVFTGERTLTFTLQSYLREKDAAGAPQSHSRSVDQKNNRYSYSVPVSLRRAEFSLRWSAGVSFYDRKNEQYALRAIEGNSQAVRLEPLDDSSNPYQLAALAHYAISRAPAISLSAGVGLDVPIKEPSFMAGVSVSAPTMSILDDSYLTIGIAYSPADRLRPKFRGLETLPATTRESDLLQRESDFAVFVSLSYGFAGGESQFKGVFSTPKK